MANNDYMVANGYTEEVAEATAQLSPAEMRAHLGELIAKSPSRARARFTADFSITPEYEELSGVDTSKMSAKEKQEHTNKLFSLKKYGTYTQAMRDADIDHSLAIPLSEAVKLRDQYRADVERLEAEMDNFDVSSFNRKAEELDAVYRQRTKGKNGMQLASVQAEYDREYDALKFEEYTKPYNALAVKRYESLERYKCYENRIKLYVATNREAIERQLERARNEEIQTNLLALAEYFEEA